ncbi:trigger factor [Motilibacter aurantiacus]|uniref:trigger factor n=1 Tax=Motilibacter aurantiacus TaxID=2714955 RepID=UPI0014093991|nr:trigger factor [Motilibacter aurantiacus]
MKTDVETLSPTRVKLTVEVGFDELKPSLDSAYKKIAGQVTIPGFRRGKIPARIIDQRFGRATVLEEAVNEALPKFYGQAVQESGTQVLGQPEVDVTEFADGQPLKFTAEVDVRPEVELPDLAGVQATVDAVTVSDEEVEEQLTSLRERFGSLRGVERAAQQGDFVSIDLSAAIGGEDVPELETKGQSYEVGSGMLEGLDEAIVGLSEGESRAFTTTLAGGPHAGEDAEVTVTVASVKERDLPEADDDFAQMASEFDTLEELRGDVRTRLERSKRLEQGVQARDKVLEALLEQIELPLPESVVKAEVDARMHDLSHQLEAAGMTKEQFLTSEEREEADFDSEVEQRAREAVKAQFVLDAIATRDQLGVSQEELSEHLVRRAQQYGMAPEQFAQQLMQNGQVPLLVSEVVRGKALAALLSAATITDTEGQPVDLEDLRPATPSAAEMAALMAQNGADGENPDQHGRTPDHEHYGHSHA